nr:MAG TPA_asm: hypothetical protein [Caudoviricetes sp.]
MIKSFIFKVQVVMLLRVLKKKNWKMNLMIKNK